MDRRATRLQLLDFTTIPMRAFHLTWMAFALEWKAVQAQSSAIADGA